MQMQWADIVVVDDNATLRELISEILTECGYTVRTAEDGVAALRCIQEQAPAILVTDLNMPVMSGFELIGLVRFRFPEVAVLAMSGALSMADLPAGTVDEFYAKGCGSIAPLLQSLRRILGTQRAAKTRIDCPIWNSSAQPEDVTAQARL